MNTHSGDAIITRDDVARFLKEEAFYLLIALMVLVMGVMSTVKMWRHETPRAAPPSIETRQLYEHVSQRTNTALRRQPERQALTVVVQAANLFLMITGTGVAFGLGWAALTDRKLFQARPFPSIRWGFWDVLKVAALFVAGVHVFRWIFVPQGVGAPLYHEGGWLSEIFGRILLIGVIVIVVLTERRGRLADLGIRGPFFRDAGIGLLAFLAIQPIMWMIVAAQLRWLPRMPIQETMQVVLLTSSPKILSMAAVMAVILAPLSEELLFRGYLQPVAERWLGGKAGIIVSAAFFAAAHMDLYALVPMTVLGLVLSYLYYRTRSLVAPITVHFAYNAIALLTALGYR